MSEYRRRLATLLVGMCLMPLAFSVKAWPGPSAAQAPEPSRPSDTASPSQDASTTVNAATSLPVSLDRIKKGLERAETGTGLRGLGGTPHFTVEVVEQQRNWVDYFKSADFSSPVVPGGNYGYEMQRLMFPATRAPLAQPYAAFTHGELLVVSLTTLLQKLLTPEVVKGVTAAQRSHNEQAAHDELARALAEYCAAQPDGGAGIFGCN